MKQKIAAPVIELYHEKNSGATLAYRSLRAVCYLLALYLDSFIPFSRCLIQVIHSLLHLRKREFDPLYCQLQGMPRYHLFYKTVLPFAVR